MILDLNECEVLGMCSQTCTNRHGSYFCMCAPNFVIEKLPSYKGVDHVCKADGYPPYLLIGMENRILKFAMDDRHMLTLYPPIYVSIS